MSVSVRLHGLPPLADSIHIRKFFTGLRIPGGGVTIVGGMNGEAIVTFTTSQDACDAVRRSGRPLMNSCIQVSLAGNKMQFHEKRHFRSVNKPGYVRISLHPFDASFSDVKMFFKELIVKSVIFLTKNKVRNGQALVKFAMRSHACRALFSTLSKCKCNSKRDHDQCFSVLSVNPSNQAEWIKFGGKPVSREKGSSLCRSTPQYDDLNSLYSREFYAHLTNVSRQAKKRHIRRFLYDLVDDHQITLVYDKNGCRTRDCFVMFITDHDYIRALGLDKSILKGRLVRVLPIPKVQMMDFVELRKLDMTEDSTSEDTSASEESPSPSSSGSKLTCVYLRNFAADVNKCDILNFFTGFSLNEENIYLLYDDNGNGLGEALVKFSSEETASSAETLNRKHFQGTEILLRCISEGQLKAFGIDSFGSSSDSVDFSAGKEECQQEDLEACVSIEDDTPDVTYDIA
ncbi:RNA-binding protein 12B-like [Mantella aurantiaca]